MRDWQQWHSGYDDPGSDLSQRLAVVVALLQEALTAAAPGPIRVASACAGTGGDVIRAVADHPRRDDVVGVLVELDPVLSATCAEDLRRAGLTTITALCTDAGTTTAYAEAVPADLLLLCGVFGNVSDDDVARTIGSASRLCAPGATVVWTRHRRSPDLTPQVRTWWREAGFTESAFVSPGADRFAVGAARLATEPQPYLPDVPLFAFV
jgi:hypothetical protein